MSRGRESRSGYDAYVRSDAWLRSPARLEELRLSGNRCRLCGRGAPETGIEVHHRTYSNLRRERPEDLCTLCVECHPAVTEVLRRRRHEARAPLQLTDTLRALPGRTLATPDRRIPNA